MSGPSSTRCSCGSDSVTPALLSASVAGREQAARDEHEVDGRGRGDARAPSQRAGVTSTSSAPSTVQLAAISPSAAIWPAIEWLSWTRHDDHRDDERERDQAGARGRDQREQRHAEQRDLGERAGLRRGAARSHRTTPTQREQRQRGEQRMAQRAQRRRHAPHRAAGDERRLCHGAARVGGDQLGAHRRVTARIHGCMTNLCPRSLEEG